MGAHDEIVAQRGRGCDVDEDKAVALPNTQKSSMVRD